MNERRVDLLYNTHPATDRRGGSKGEITLSS